MSIEDQFIRWSKTQEKMKEIKSNIEGIDLEVVLYRGRYIYLLANCPTPAVVADTMNISSNDSRIQNIFKDFFPFDEREKLHYSLIDQDRKFEIRFFQNKQEIETIMAKEEKEYASIESPRLFCNLI